MVEPILAWVKSPIVLVFDDYGDGRLRLVNPVDLRVRQLDPVESELWLTWKKVGSSPGLADRLLPSFEKEGFALRREAPDNITNFDAYTPASRVWLSG